MRRTETAEDLPRTKAWFTLTLPNSNLTAKWFAKWNHLIHIWSVSYFRKNFRMFAKKLWGNLFSLAAKVTFLLSVNLDEIWAGKIYSETHKYLIRFSMDWNKCLSLWNFPPAFWPKSQHEFGSTGNSEFVLLRHQLCNQMFWQLPGAPSDSASRSQGRELLHRGEGPRGGVSHRSGHRHPRDQAPHCQHPQQGTGLWGKWVYKM